jgi:hypothetical protein
VTPDDVREATAEAAAAAEQVSAHLQRLADRLEATMPVAPDVLSGWGDDPRERMHALLRMFEQLFDLVTRKLFRGFLFLSGETIAGLSAQNQFRRVEALGGITSADRWMEIGATRNVLVHDYPVNAAAQAARTNRAWHDLPTLLAETHIVIAKLRSESMIP